MDYIEISGKNIDDAITEACQKLEVTSNRLDYEVIEKGSSGFLGFGNKPAVIKARIKQDKPEAAPEKKPVEKTVDKAVNKPVEKSVDTEDKEVKKEGSKKLYYLSFEFLMGRLLSANVLNLMQTKEYKVIYT